MPIDFPSSPSSGQRYDYLSKSWIWNSIYWASVGASGNVTSGQLGTPVLFSGNIASGSIGSFHFASGVVGSGGGGGGSSGAIVLTSGSVTSGLIGDNSVNSGNIGSGQVGRFQINDFNPMLSVNKGYFAGGSTGAVVTTADMLTYSTDTTIALTTANLSQARSYLAGCSGDSIKGYFAGGSTNFQVATADKITYSNNITAAQTSANLSQARYFLAGVSEGLTKGYFAGGLTGQLSGTLDKLTYSTDTTAAATTTLLLSRYSLAGCSGNSTKGYFAGGMRSAPLNYTDKLTYLTDTIAAQASANLSQARKDLAGLSEGTTKGYFAGGDSSSGTYVTTADLLTYSNDTTTAYGTANLSQARSGLASASNGAIKGYFAGGQSGSNVATADKLTYSNDTTAAQASANLSQARSYLAGVGQTFTNNFNDFGNNSITSGNIASGQIGEFHFLSGVIRTATIINSGSFGNSSVNSGNITASTISTFHLSNASVYSDAVLSGNVSTFKFANNAVSSGNISISATLQVATKGFFAGGNVGAEVVTADKLTYSNDTTTAQTSANLSQAKAALAGCSGEGTKGYFAGGTTGGGTPTATADKLTYSTETTVSQTTANLSQARGYLAGVSEGSTKGYFAGGDTGSQVATADKLTYSTDTTAAQASANLSQARYYLASVDGTSTKGYFAGGNNGSHVATADKLTYATDTTVAQTTANLSQARDVLAGCSGDSTKGYFAGGGIGVSPGVATADKLTYATDTTIAQTSANLTQAKYWFAGVSEGTTKGYFAGGYTNSIVATADKVTYSTDTTTAQTTANLSQARYQLAGVGQEEFTSYNGIPTTSLASGGFRSGAFGDNAISSGDILSGRIVASHIGSGEINSSHIVSGALFNYNIGSVGAYNLSNNLVLSGNIGSGRISIFAFENGAILSGNIASGVIGNTHFGNASVTSGAIPSGTVIFNMVGALAAAPYNFADVALSSGNFALQSVTGENLADGVWQQPTTFYVSGGITAFMFNNNAIVSGSLGTLDIPVANLNAGYFAGGLTGSYVTTADKLVYSTETTTAQASANLSQARGYLAGCSGDSTKGYFAGGYTPAILATVDKLTYSNNTTVAQTTANLSQARSDLAGISEGLTKGYFAGGYAPSTVATADKLTYSNDTTAAQTTANLSQARYDAAGCDGDGIKGYFAGGYIAGGVATADKLTYSTDTTIAQTTANLSQGRFALAGVSEGSTKGYFAGGSGTVALADKLTYSTDTTAAQTTANLSQARYYLAGVSEGSTKGYFAGGLTSFGGVSVATADKLTYSTDTTAAQTTANLSQARNTLAGVDGGISSSNDPRNGPIVILGKLTTTNADKIRSTNFASGSILSGNIASGVVGSFGSFNISNNAIRSGNIASGQVSISVHLANATILSGNIGSGVIRFPTFFGDTTQYVNIRSGQIGNIHIGEKILSNPVKQGYFAGGNTNAVVATADKILYSIDTTAAQASANLSQARYGLAGCSGEGTKGYFAGGFTSVEVTTTDKITYSNDITSSQASANLSLARFFLASISDGSTKGYFAGGRFTGFQYVATADKLTYSNDTTAAQGSANLSQARASLAGVSGTSTKGYFAGGDTGGISYASTADRLIYSTDTTTAQGSANLSQARFGLAGISDGSTKGYFAGGMSAGGLRQTTADKLTYSTDITVAQTTANLSQARPDLAGVSEGSTKGYFAGGSTGGGIYVTTADKLTFSTDTTAAQTTANLSQARQYLAGVDGGTSYTITYSQFMTSSQISSGTISITTASGQNAAYPYPLAETAQINTNRPIFDYFRAGELISGLKAVCIGSGNLLRRAERASGLRLPAIGVTSGAILSGTVGTVYYYGGVGRTGTLAQNSGLNNGISGFQGLPLYVGSGGNIVNQSGMRGASSGAPFLSGDMQQQIGIAISGGIFVMPSPRITRSGFLGTLPYDI